MTKKELLERTRKAIQALAALPPEEHFRQMIEAGLINEEGEVLWNLEEARKQEEEARKQDEAERPATP
jgi:hypothetical protein